MLSGKAARAIGLAIGKSDSSPSAVRLNSTFAWRHVGGTCMEGLGDLCIFDFALH